MPYISVTESRALQRVKELEEKVVSLEKETESKSLQRVKELEQQVDVLEKEIADLQEKLKSATKTTTKTTTSKKVVKEAPAVDEAPVGTDGETK